MKINRELSSKFKRITSLLLVGGLFLGNGIRVYAKEMTPEDIQRQYHKYQSSYIESVENPEDLFDEKFVQFCQDGLIVFDDKEYSMSDVYIIFGELNGEDIVYLSSFREPTLDLLTGKEVDSSYKRKRMMLLGYSDVFDEYYSDHKDEIEDRIVINEEFINKMNNFRGNINYSLPVTYYYDNNQHGKHK